MDSNDKTKETGEQAKQINNQELIEEEKAMSKPSQEEKKDEDDSPSTKEHNKEENDSPTPSASGKKRKRKKKILDSPPEPDESESVPTPPSDDAENKEQLSRAKERPHNPWGRRQPIVRKTRPMIQPVTKQKKSKPSNKSSKSTETYKTSKFKVKKSSQPKSTTQLSDSTSEEGEEKPTTEVKQFSFPQYKILSGATVAAVKMRPQKVSIPRNTDDFDDSKHWAEGLFQPTVMSLKLRLIRLVLVWLFFRVLNKQTGWLSDALGLGLQDEPTDPPPPRPKQPGERYIKVFHESSPHPIHVRVRKPPGSQPF